MFSVGILGATGMVGQKYIQLLQNHPLFQIKTLAASSRSSGKTYLEGVGDRWQMPTPIPQEIQNIKVLNVLDVDKVSHKLDLVFSAFEMPDKKQIQDLEIEYAKAGLAVFSNASAHRWSPKIPMLLPEINANHLDIISEQQKYYGFPKNGLIVVKPNCSLQSYLIPIFALNQAGFKVDKIILTTMQAVSGAGYPGVASLDVIDNLIPLIGGEEIKTEQEPLKILGRIVNGDFKNKSDLKISATCTRVPVSDGHTASVSLKFKNDKPSLKEIKRIWNDFKSVPQEMNLPFAPKKPIYYSEIKNRPQPKKDRNIDKAMAVTVGRLRECEVFDYKFVGLSHNTVRGAAGGGILNAELYFLSR